jgi:hypothetical protein
VEPLTDLSFLMVEPHRLFMSLITIGKFKIDANTSDDIRGLEIICRNGIKIVANNFTTLEVFALTN